MGLLDRVKAVVRGASVPSQAATGTTNASPATKETENSRGSAADALEPEYVFAGKPIGKKKLKEIAADFKKAAYEPQRTYEQKSLLYYVETIIDDQRKNRTRIPEPLLNDISEIYGAALVQGHYPDHNKAAELILITTDSDSQPVFRREQMDNKLEFNKHLLGKAKKLNGILYCAVDRYTEAIKACAAYASDNNDTAALRIMRRIAKEIDSEVPETLKMRAADLAEELPVRVQKAFQLAFVSGINKTNGQIQESDVIAKVKHGYYKTSGKIGEYSYRINTEHLKALQARLESIFPVELETQTIAERGPDSLVTQMTAKQ